MTVGSLFSGIGGFDLAASRVWGWDCVRWQVEVDPWCSRVLAKHWPDVRRYGDIRELTGGELEPVDLVCGGFPCQDISDEGTHAGLAGERSGLWRQFARLLGVLRPRYAVVENVSALLGRGFGEVLGDLAALGFDAEWHCIPAACLGAPHVRDRAWLIAYPEGYGPEEGLIRQLLPQPSGARTWNARSSDGSRDPLRQWGWTPETVFCRVDDGISAGLRRRASAAFGNAIVPQVAEVLFRLIEEAQE